MSDDKISLDFLGEQMLRMQADLRGVRSEQLRQESDQSNMRADLRRLEVKVEVLDGKVDRLDGKVDRLDAKVDAHDASNRARFDQIDRTMALNLEIMLKAFDSARR